MNAALFISGCCIGLTAWIPLNMRAAQRVIGDRAVARRIAEYWKVRAVRAEGKLALRSMAVAKGNRTRAARRRQPLDQPDTS